MQFIHILFGFFLNRFFFIICVFLGLHSGGLFFLLYYDYTHIDYTTYTVSLNIIFYSIYPYDYKVPQLRNFLFYKKKEIKIYLLYDYTHKINKKLDLFLG
ncbi:hypothetical protein EG351_10900 [Chryseobacterium bernardetii]|nr:hypothetical protein EG351_10900 [Chryseobacterium bernardetii]